jgi:hypothetical protein
MISDFNDLSVTLRVHLVYYVHYDFATLFLTQRL